MGAIKYRIFKGDNDVTLDECEYIVNQIGKAFLGGDGWVYEVSKATANPALSGGFTISTRFSDQHLFKVCFHLGKNKYNHEIWTGQVVRYKNRKYFINNERYFFKLHSYLPAEMPILITPEVLLDIDLENVFTEKKEEIEPEFKDEMFQIEKKL